MSYVKTWIAIFHTGIVPALCQQVLKVKTALVDNMFVTLKMTRTAAAGLSALQTCIVMRPAQDYCAWNQLDTDYSDLFA